MAIALTIAGATKSWRAGSLKIMDPANGRSTASLSIRSNDGTYRPALDAEVIITEDGTRIFGGLVQRPSERGILGDNTGAYDAIETTISAVDFHSYTERRYVNETLAAGTMKSQLTTLVANYLTSYGVTLHASQVDGPTFPALEYAYRPLTEVLNEMATLSAKYGAPYVWTIDHFKVLRMFQPSTQAAPFNIVEGDTNTVGDITVETTRDKYANKIIVKVPTKTEIEREETFTQGVSTYPYVPQYTVLKHWGYVTHAGNYETLRTPTDPDTASWTFDPGANTLTRDAGSPAASAVTVFKFDGSYTGEGIATSSGEIATYGIYEKVVKVDSVPADTTAQALADGYLAESLLTPKTIKYKTFGLGVLPGQTQTISMPLRNLTALSCVVADVVAQDYGKGDKLLRSVTLKSGTSPHEGWREVYKIWAGDKTGGSSAPSIVASAPVGSVGPAPPDESVQSNQNGVLSGDAAFKFKKTGKSVVIGDGSTITATEYDSCFIAGLNCHITN